MKPFETTVVEVVNHLIKEHPQVAPAIEAIARANVAEHRLNQRYFGLNNLDEKLEKWLNYENGYFVELGANNGVDQSNTLHYERYKNWRGILVEPVPHNYLACRKVRSNENHFFCNACTSFEYQDKFVEIAYSNLMSTALGLDSDIAQPMEHAKVGRQFLEPTDDNLVFGAVATPLNILLQRANAPHLMDLLSLDVEGAELEVLRGIDHTTYRFKYLCIESRSSESLARYLKGYNYAFVEKLSAQDYLFQNAFA
jgi:FkbM family methyltransferase